MSHQVDNDPARVIDTLRRQQVKYTAQIEKCQGLQAAVAEDQGVYSIHSQPSATNPDAERRGERENNGSGSPVT